jgi:Flp pilus assembly protein TadG
MFTGAPVALAVPRAWGCYARGRGVFVRVVGLLRLFVAACEGATAIVGAIVIVPMLASVGLAVDYVQLIRARSELQSALDGATLAGAKALQVAGVSEAEAAAAKFFATAAIVQRGAQMSSVTIDTATRDVTAQGSLVVKTAFMSVVGRRSVPLHLVSKSASGLGNELEIAFMLDLSSSMAGTRFSDLKTATTNFTNLIMTPTGGAYTARIAFAPFASGVNVGTLNTSAKTVSVSSANNCVDYRQGGEAYTDAPPGPGAYFDDLPVVSGWPCLATPIMPLEGDATRVRTAINNLVLSEGTAGHIGAAWAWYLLSPRWSSLFATASQPKPYNSPFHRKVAILFTDGENFPTDGGSAPLSNAAGDANMIRQCEGMRAAGITVYAVGFEVSAQRALDTLRACASTPDHHYMAYGGAELDRVFASIALSLMRIRLKS